MIQNPWLSSISIRCGNCGKNYQRKVNAGRHIWKCATYLRMGKAYCPAKQIPESIIIDAVTQALGMTEFDENAFRRYIREIRVIEAQKFTLVFTDGREQICCWHDSFRIDVWTPEKRMKAAYDAGKKNLNE